jgi:RPA family protein
MKPRMTTVRASVADIIEGQFDDVGGPRVVSKYGVELRRVGIVGFVVEKFVNEDRNLASITIDDGSAVIQARAFGVDTSVLEEVQADQLYLIIGKVREYEDRVYVLSELIRQIDDGNYMTLHMLQRLRGLLTLSGVTTTESEEVDESEAVGLEEYISKSEGKKDAQESAKPRASMLGKLSRQILNYIEEKKGPDGVKIEEVIEHFHDQGIDKMEINMRVVELLEGGFVQERPEDIGVLDPSG